MWAPMMVEYFCVKESCVHYWVSTSGRLQRKEKKEEEEEREDGEEEEGDTLRGVRRRESRKVSVHPHRH